MQGNKKFKQDPATTMGSFSKNLLSLKFMQRAKEQLEKAALEKNESFDSSMCKDLKNKQQYILNQSYQFCENLRFGRFSFKGMNTDIENLMFNNKPNRESTGSIKRAAPPSDSSCSDNEIDNLDSDNDDEEKDAATLEKMEHSKNFSID